MDILRRIGKFTVTLSIVLIFVGTLLAQQKEQEKDISIGERFHKETSLTRQGVVGDRFRAKPEQPPQYKVYPNANKIELPKPEYMGMTVEETLKKRRSIRNYSTKSISKAQLSQLLFAAQGVTGKMYGKALRTAPSAGALYPFEVYIIANNVQNLVFSVKNHLLLCLSYAYLADGKGIQTLMLLCGSIIADSFCIFTALHQIPKNCTKGR